MIMRKVELFVVSIRPVKNHFFKLLMDDFLGNFAPSKKFKI